jgi:flagellar hook protein FlgE
VTQYFVKTGTNAVTAHYAFDGTATGVNQALTFGTDGQLTAPAGAVTLNFGTPVGAAPLTVDVTYAGTTQMAGDAITTTNSADGFQAGTFIGVQIAKDGSVQAQYSNGEKQTVATIAMATFPAEGDLTPITDTAWTSSSGSGLPLYSQPGIGMTGELIPGSLEQSNVDIAAELVKLMSSQRNYQANTKVIQTENQMMQTLVQAL